MHMNYVKKLYFVNAPPMLGSSAIVLPVHPYRQVKTDFIYQGPVVESIVSLTNLLRGQLVKRITTL